MLFGSVRVEKAMKSLVSRDGNRLEPKSVKRNEIPKKGQFNIMLDYGRKILYRFSEGVVKEKRNGGYYYSPPFVSPYFKITTISRIVKTMVRDSAIISKPSLYLFIGR